MAEPIQGEACRGVQDGSKSGRKSSDSEGAMAAVRAAAVYWAGWSWVKDVVNGDERRRQEMYQRMFGARTLSRTMGGNRLAEDGKCGPVIVLSELC